MSYCATICPSPRHRSRCRNNGTFPPDDSWLNQDEHIPQGQPIQGWLESSVAWSRKRSWATFQALESELRKTKGIRAKWWHGTQELVGARRYRKDYRSTRTGYMEAKDGRYKAETSSNPVLRGAVSVLDTLCFQLTGFLALALVGTGQLSRRRPCWHRLRAGSVLSTCTGSPSPNTSETEVSLSVFYR